EDRRHGEKSHPRHRMTRLPAKNVEVEGKDLRRSTIGPRGAHFLERAEEEELFGDGGLDHAWARLLEPLVDARFDVDRIVGAPRPDRMRKAPECLIAFFGIDDPPLQRRETRV